MSLTTAAIFFLNKNSFLSLGVLKFLQSGVYILYFVLVSVFIFTLVSKFAKQSTVVLSPLTIIEEELGSIEDYLIIGTIFVLAIMCFVAAPLILTTNSFSQSLAPFLILFTTACFLPTSVLQRFGIEAPQYVRGGGSSSNFLYEFILDFVAILTIFVRFGVQNIRIVFLLLAYWELYTFVSRGLSFQDFVVLAPANYSITSVINFIFGLFLYLYYVGHFCILYTMQVAAYLGLSFWLFFFLYTNFSVSGFDFYFRSVRHAP